MKFLRKAWEKFLESSKKQKLAQILSMLGGLIAVLGFVITLIDDSSESFVLLGTIVILIGIFMASFSSDFVLKPDESLSPRK